MHCPKRGKTFYFGQWEGVALPEKQGNFKFWSKEVGCIARNVGKLTILVNGKGVHCPKSRETLNFGQWRVVALPEKQGNSKFWSMEGGCIAQNVGKL
ncbi:hypothetical protein AM1BK_15530 [Neobacillus kokaensis]|uniref:Uncharacterized protein n=1 Tax=Neobacillus kokaensis TaxID=2759023 RepID=A0ABQ3N2D0_9BACI|nr:hypothetical protein AM1BK_15530 [Neobacillus kokaensis]